MDDFLGLEIIYVIVNFGIGSKVLKTAKESGVTGGTVMLGRGTVNNGFCDFLGITDIRKEIVLMVANNVQTKKALEAICKELNLKKPNHGIAFTLPVCNVLGANSCKNFYLVNKGDSEGKTVYKMITVIIDKGKAENVIEAAVKAGSKGGTIINARGSGIHETSKVFAMDIEPEKEIVLILSETKNTENIIGSIKNNLKMDEPGNGFIYIQNVNETFGLTD